MHERPRLIPVQDLAPGGFVCTAAGTAATVARVTKRRYQGPVIGLRHTLSPTTLWLTPDHQVLCRPAPRTMGGQMDWSGSPLSSLERRQRLRREMTPPERILWKRLRSEQLGVKFRRQHSVGPYIADFYSRAANLVVEVDGAAVHSGVGQQGYDRARDEFMRAIGLTVIRFSASQVVTDANAVAEAIRAACTCPPVAPDQMQWIKAADVREGDVVLFGIDRTAVVLSVVESKQVEAEVSEVVVENRDSLSTEVCAVQAGVEPKHPGRV
ncbi:MAG: endonuclease domain-containing protein [Candidatus Zixiibacteriota bacterium]